MLNKFGLLERDMDSIIAVLIKQPTVEKSFIFGSRAKGNFKKGNDVDLALKGRYLNFDVISQISYQLNEETKMPYNFDVLNYHTLEEPDLINHIDSIGIEIYSK